MPDEPIYTRTTEDLWRRLPQIYRDEDEKRDWQFKRWLSGMTDIIGDIENLLTRIEYVGPYEDDAPDYSTSDLAFSVSADRDWLDWIGMVRGIKTATGIAESQRRVILSQSAYDGGTKASIQRAVQATLIGTKFCKVYDHSDSGNPLYTQGEFEMLIVTRADETAIGYQADLEDSSYVYVDSEPDSMDLDLLMVAGETDPFDEDLVFLSEGLSTNPVETVISAGLKPAGVFLTHRFEAASDWDAFESEYPTWDALDQDTWDDVEQADGIPD